VNARQTRAERILDVAAELLLRWGYNRVTIDDLAAQVGVGKGTIYLHWNTREELFYAVIAREYIAATDEVLTPMRRDPAAVLPHRLMRAYFLVTMRRPLIRAVFVSDLEVLGKLVKGVDRALEAQQDAAFNDYLRLLAEHGLLRADVSPEELTYAVTATVGGFLLTDTLISEQYQPDLERKADLLALTVQRAFEIDRPPPAEALRAVVPRVIEIFTEAADRYRALVRRAYK
jgi:AcrR family transcriptional regulator